VDFWALLTFLELAIVCDERLLCFVWVDARGPFTVGFGDLFVGGTWGDADERVEGLVGSFALFQVVVQLE
jgi:hypothetical protein